MPTLEKPSLPELQHWMRWVLTRPDGVEHALHAPKNLPKNWTRGPEPRRFLTVIGESTDVSRSERLSIYGEGYFLRIVDCLAAIYDSLKNVIGEHEFSHHVGREYLVKHPSTHRCIDNVGSHFADFLKRHAETKTFPFLPDLARLEWAYHESFYADEKPPFDFSSLENQPLNRWVTAKVEIDPSVRLLALDWPVDDIWRADGKWTRRRLKAVKSQRCPVLIYRRPDALVRVKRLDPAAFALLSALNEGKKFGDALKAALRKSATAPDQVMTWFREWAEAGVIRKVSFR